MRASLWGKARPGKGRASAKPPRLEQQRVQGLASGRGRGGRIRSEERGWGTGRQECVGPTDELLLGNGF